MDQFLTPVLALILWTFVMWVWMYSRRIPAMNAITKNTQRFIDEPELKDQIPAKAKWAADNYNHLHEQPVIFYALMFYLFLTAQTDPLNLYLAWGYVIIRVLHSLVQVTSNKVMMRFPLFALGDRQAVKMRTNASFENGVAVKFQMMRRDGCGQPLRSGPNKLRRVLGRDMLKYDFKPREIHHERCQDLINEHGFPVKNIDVIICDFAVHQKRHADFLHGFEGRINIVDIGNPVRGIRRRIGRIELAGREYPVLESGCDIICVGLIGQITRHERGEFDVIIQGRHDPVPIGIGHRRRCHRRRKIGHHDRAGKLFGRMIDDGLQHRPVA